ncbi:hypothetical protein CYMTET_51121 [Cymbomonas tetramitiformis]|uniref:Uncharacterized protein n=1 Tax=Cymbomonas tetramitiformis TaxID=36881 RepID=A0AAE0ESH0_9CHLO|nr:hypothetical protein CYMTET_51121 [Cymbomonas tetramitiformis]
MNMLSAVDQHASSDGYATDTDDEDVAPAQPPPRLGCGVPVPGFSRSLLTTYFVCALFIVCAAAAPLTATGVGGAGEHTCTAPPVGGAGLAATAAAMPAAFPPAGSSIERGASPWCVITRCDPAFPVMAAGEVVLEPACTGWLDLAPRPFGTACGCSGSSDAAVTGWCSTVSGLHLAHLGRGGREWTIFNRHVNIGCSVNFFHE